MMETDGMQDFFRLKCDFLTCFSERTVRAETLDVLTDVSIIIWLQCLVSPALSVCFEENGCQAVTDASVCSSFQSLS